jgi:hypothetical protein
VLLPVVLVLLLQSLSPVCGYSAASVAAGA